MVEENAKTTEEKKEKLPCELMEEESLPGSMMRWKIKVTREQFNPQLEEKLRTLRKKVLVPGFRPGHAPIKLVQIQYGDQAKGEVVEELFPRYLEQMIEEKELEVASEGGIKDWSVEDDGSLVLELVQEVMPRIEVAAEEYEKLEVAVPRREYKELMLEQRLKALQEQNVVFEPKEGDEGFEGEDGLVANVEVRDERGELVKELVRHNHFFAYPQLEFPKELMEALLGKKRGEQVSVAVKAERRDEKGEKISQTDTYQVEIQEIKRRILPELDDDFAADVGFASLKELKQRIEESIKKELEEEERQHVVALALEKLGEKVTFEPPQSMVQNELERLVQRELEFWTRTGYSIREEQVHSFVEQKREEAKLRVKNRLLLEQIARQEKIELSEEELEEELKRLADAEGRKPLAIRARLEAEKRFDAFKEGVRLKKLTDFLFARATINYLEEEKKSEKSG